MLQCRPPSLYFSLPLSHPPPSSGVRRLGAMAAQPDGSGEVRLLTRKRTPTTLPLLPLFPSTHSSLAPPAVGRRTEHTRGCLRGMRRPLSVQQDSKRATKDRGSATYTGRPEFVAPAGEVGRGEVAVSAIDPPNRRVCVPFICLSHRW